MKMNYNDTVMDHFTNPRNVGEVPNADGVGQVGNPACGDIMKISLRVKDDRIEEVKFKTFGCGAAIANSSMMTEMVRGKSVGDAAALKNTDIAEALGGLPPIKMHCSSLAADALHAAIEDYKKKKAAQEVSAEAAAAS
jgi:nitrogen fixation NifU-like protein